VNLSALTLPAFLLGQTKRLRAGTAVTLLPLHAPVHVAEQAALLDHVSGGRFDLGVGRAGPVADYEVIGRGIQYWQDGLPEAIDLMLSAWDGKTAADSALYRFREERPRPRPLTQPHVPTFLAANSSSSVGVAAARGLPMLFMFTKSHREIAAMVAHHAELTVSRGHPIRHDHGYTALTQVVDTPSAAEDMARRVIAEHPIETHRRAFSGWCKAFATRATRACSAISRSAPTTTAHMRPSNVSAVTYCLKFATLSPKTLAPKRK
jgi:alkanesulfonate monooxygenase SsuD/methylene tetrahydromethanopterin reductase-like flavin-dependent oxidoreductase (luciferase family)